MIPLAHLPRPGTEHDDRPGRPRLRIGDAARAIGVSPSVLRLWERQELVRPARSRSGYRLYSDADVERLRQVRRMRADRVNAPGIRRLLSRGTGPADEATPAAPVGRRLRELRLGQRLSLRVASARADLSPSFLSAIERGSAAASVGTLQRLTTLYGVTVVDLFAPPVAPTRVVRTAARRTLALPDAGVRIEQLAEAATELEPQLFVLAAGADSAAAYAHAGEEFVYVLEGGVTFWVGDRERYRLRAGDSLTFPSTMPHRWRNRADGETRLLWINTPPTF